MSDKTVYVPLWFAGDEVEFDCFRVFKSRGKALDFLTNAIFEIAEQYEVPVRDFDQGGKKLTEAELRDVLGSNGAFTLVTEYDQSCVAELASLCQTEFRLVETTLED